MTNKELQAELARYPDDVFVRIVYTGNSDEPDGESEELDRVGEEQIAEGPIMVLCLYAAHEDY